MTRASAKTRRLARDWRLWAGLAAAALAVWALADVAALPSGSEIDALQKGVVRETATMRARKAEAKAEGRRYGVRQQWLELGSISPQAISAVLASEDARFFAHKGIDAKEIKAAVETAVEDGRRARGASTITQQVAKNLFLSEKRSLWRKLEEVVLAFRLEGALSKRRILTLYLNIAEWGEGVFGIGAAARAHFGVSASELTLAQCAALAAMLPNPHRIHPKNPKALVPRARHVIDRMEEDGFITADQAEAARAEIDGWSPDAKPKDEAEPAPAAAAAPSQEEPPAPAEPPPAPEPEPAAPSESAEAPAE